MTVNTYGQHAENAARALDRLIVEDRVPVADHAVEQLMHSREVLVQALRQRLFDLSQGTWYPPLGHLPASIARPSLTGLDSKLPTLVGGIAFSLPTLPTQEERSSVDHLTPPSRDKTVHTWQVAAIEHLSASHALSAAAEQPWRTEPGAGWWVLRDVAVALEAVVVLDDRLDEVGLLSGHQRPDEVLTLDEKRMVLSQAARLATWYATSASPDDASPQLHGRARPVVVQPVVVVGGPADLASAQRRLARLMRPMSAKDAFYTGEPAITAQCARQITVSQLGLCRAFTSVAEQTPHAGAFSAFFADRAEVLDALMPQISHLGDVRAEREPQRLRYWQQSEIWSAVARMSRGRALRLSPAQVAELAAATHEVTHNLGKALRLELLRKNGNLINVHPHLHDGPVRVRRRSRLETTLTDLVNMPAPEELASQFGTSLQRAALQSSLNMTPPQSRRRPTPFPSGQRASGAAATL